MTMQIKAERDTFSNENYILLLLTEITRAKLFYCNFSAKRHKYYFDVLHAAFSNPARFLFILITHLFFLGRE